MKIVKNVRIFATSIVVTGLIAVTAVAIPLNSAFACDTKPQPPKSTPTPKPVVSFSCSGMDVTNIDRTHFDLTAHASVQNATVTSFVFTVVDSKGKIVDSATVTTSALSAVYHFNQSDAGTYTISAVINTDHGSTKGVCDCSKTVTVKPAPVVPPVTPPVTPPTTPVTPVTPVTPATPQVQAATTLPNTGPGDDVAGLFAGATSIGAAGHYALAFRRNRRGQ